MSDIFRRVDAVNLLANRHVYMFGDSNMRSIYRDLIYLLVEGGITPQEMLRRSKTQYNGHCGDRVLESSGVITAGRHYVEVRAYEDSDLYVQYRFITKVYSSDVCKELQAIEDGKLPMPNIVIMNSCIWDLTRWGANQEDQYKENMVEMFSHLRRILPADTLVIWLTTLPVSTEKIKGGVLIKQLEFVQHSMEFIVMEANKFAQELCKAFNFNLLDLHYYMRFHLQRRTKDGLHWEPPALRMMTNTILTHIALNFGRKLPGNSEVYILRDVKSIAEEAKESCQESIDDLHFDQEIKEKIINALSGKSEKKKIENRVICQAKRTLTNKNCPVKSKRGGKQKSEFDRRPQPKSTYVKSLASYYNQEITRSLNSYFNNNNNNNNISSNYQGVSSGPSNSRRVCFFQDDFCQEQYQGMSSEFITNQNYYGTSQWNSQINPFLQGISRNWGQQLNQPSGYQQGLLQQNYGHPQPYQGSSYWNHNPHQFHFQGNRGYYPYNS